MVVMFYREVQRKHYGRTEEEFVPEAQSLKPPQFIKTITDLNVHIILLWNYCKMISGKKFVCFAGKGTSAGQIRCESYR